MNDVINKFVEVTLVNDEDFLKIKETLTRIGVASRKDQTLYQSCHILHKQGHYYITHFKEMFLLDGKSSDIEESDIGRRNTIVNLLSEWGLIVLVDKVKSAAPLTPMNQIKIVSFKDKKNWTLVAKYTIGRKRTDAN
jgi:Bacteriophage translational regulator.